MYLFAPKRKICYFCSKVFPGPLGPHLSRGKLEANSRIGRYILEILCWNPSLMENWFSIVPIFGNEFCNSFFVQKSIIPPLRTKPYYSKPKWRSRRVKSLKIRKMQISTIVHPSHIFAPKVPFGVIFSFLSYFYTFGSKWPKKASRNHYSHKLLSHWAQKTHFELQNA